MIAIANIEENVDQLTIISNTSSLTKSDTKIILLILLYIQSFDHIFAPLRCIARYNTL